MLRDVNIINTSSVKNMQSVNKNIALDIPISVEQKKLNNEKIQRKLRQIFYTEKKNNGLWWGTLNLLQKYGRYY